MKLCKARNAPDAVSWVVGSLVLSGAASLAHVGPPQGSMQREAVVKAWSDASGRYVGVLGRELGFLDGAGRMTQPIARVRNQVVAIDVDRSENLIALVCASSRMAVEIFGRVRGRFRRLGGGVEARRHPSRVSIGDVDGDGKADVLVLVTGRARFDPRSALRPFVYGWDGRRLYPKWLGSRLSRPFVDATLGDLDDDGRDELVAVESTQEGKRELAAYEWRGFGFERIAIGVACNEIAELDVEGDGRIRCSMDGARMHIRLVGDRLETATRTECRSGRNSLRTIP